MGEDPYDPYEAMAWYERFTAALDGYAAAVAAALAARGITGVTYEVDAGIDMAGIDLSVPALPAGVRGATVYFSDDLGWHYQPCVGAGPADTWACLTPVTATTPPEGITVTPAEVAERIAALTAGGYWPGTAQGRLTPIDDLADGYLDHLIDTLERRTPSRRPDPGGPAARFGRTAGWRRPGRRPGRRRGR